MGSRYLENNAHRMRRVMGGEKATLELRCIYINGVWQPFMDFNVQQEQQRIHHVTVKTLKAANEGVHQQLKVVLNLYGG